MVTEKYKSNSFTFYIKQKWSLVNRNQLSGFNIVTGFPCVLEICEGLWVWNKQVKGPGKLLKTSIRYTHHWKVWRIFEVNFLCRTTSVRVSIVCVCSAQYSCFLCVVNIVNHVCVAWAPWVQPSYGLISESSRWLRVIESMLQEMNHFATRLLQSFKASTKPHLDFTRHIMWLWV